MEVILLCDVKKVGKKGDIVKVSDGYAANFLLPKKLAVIASSYGKEIKAKQDQEALEKFNKDKEISEQLKEKLEQITLVIYAKTGEDDRMFGSISSKEVCEELKKQFDLEVDRKKAIGENQIKTLGVTILKFELFKGVVANVKVNVLKK